MPGMVVNHASRNEGLAYEIGPLGHMLKSREPLQNRERFLILSLSSRTRPAMQSRTIRADVLNGARKVSRLGECTDAKRRPDEIVRKLREDAESRLLPIAAEFRRLRNDAGHPASLGPVDPADVHANLLLFPSTAKLFKRLRDWVVSYYV